MTDGLGRPSYVWFSQTKTMILLIDNYDSFVYNLARYFRELGSATRVVRNDGITVKEIRQLRPAGIVLSPGPGKPVDAGISIAAVREFAGRIPLLGICLGHQAIAEAFGGLVIRAPEPVHGRTSDVYHDGTGLFTGLESPLLATRYHSLIVDDASLPAELTVDARLADGLIMGLAHQRHPVFGLQFHPESVLTNGGHHLLTNFLHTTGLHAEPVAADDLALETAGEEILLPQPLHW